MTRPNDLVRDGAESYLTDIDLLSLALANRRAAMALLGRFGTLQNVLGASVVEVEHCHSSSANIGVRIRVLAELVRRTSATPLERGQPLNCAADIAAAYGARLADEPREHFLAIHLDAKNRVISDRVVSVGHLTASLVHPRETFATAIRESAAAIAFVHQHPSGDPEPSREDIELTRRLMRAGELLGINVLDHVVVAGGRHVSIAERGLA